ncbi:hypothetical protein KEM56_000044 [Ascosphaera pollenicola]|nr:hypothetical protein KEM56_000044 [Ascosphaera pollenicola]
MGSACKSDIYSTFDHPVRDPLELLAHSIPNKTILQQLTALEELQIPNQVEAAPSLKTQSDLSTPMYRRTGGLGEAPSDYAGRNLPATVTHGPPHGPTTTASGAASAACTPCRTVKMKCTREVNETVCNRCKRKSLTCFYETHRRGRKPGTKLRPKAQRDRERELERERQRARERENRVKAAQDAEKLHRTSSVSGSQYIASHASPDGDVQLPITLQSLSRLASKTPGGFGLKSSPDGLGHVKMKMETIPESEDAETQSSESLTHKKSGSMASVDAQSSRQATISGRQEISQSPTATVSKRSVSAGSASAGGASMPASTTQPISNTDGLAPFRLLRKSATAGNFTIANILNAEEDSDSSSSNEKANRNGSYRTGDNEIDEQNDPVLRVLVNLPTAQGLFENFFQYMNPFICQFDPRLHTMKYIRTKSAFLFSSLLCAASKFFAPELYRGLYDHVEAQLKEIMPAGQKSTEIVQGILLMTYWKQPCDSRAWLLVGYAIRACIEMGWHQLKPTNSEPYMMILQSERELELRERRNKERIWLLLFVYDRSVSLQVGKPWMIQMDPLIRASDTWCQHAYAVPGIDQIMSAFVQLRILGSDLLDLCFVDPKTCAPETYQRNESVLKLFNGNLDQWETHWYKTVEDASASISHRFIIHFYGTHVRLLLNSYRLQLSILGGASISKQALWVCYMSALEMLRLVIDRLGAGSHLFYCQDSVHVMIAYATVILIKMLLSLPGELPPESETQVLDIIREASEAFGRQQPPGNTSCYYQYRFLANIANHYRRTRRESIVSVGDWARRMSTVAPNNSVSKPSTTLDRISGTIAAASGLMNLDRRASAPTALYQSMMPPPQRLSISRQSQQISPISENGPRQSIYGDMSPPGTAGSVPTAPVEQQYPPQTEIAQVTTAQGQPIAYPPPQTLPNVPMNTQANYNSGSVASNGQDQMFATSNGLLNWPMAAGIGVGGLAAPYQLFTDPIVWEDLFAGAGFSVNSGAFLPTNLADG